MITSLQDVDLTSYSMILNNMSIGQNISQTTISLEFTLPQYDSEGMERNIQNFFTDLRIMNLLRNHPSAGVRNHYEQLLALLALTNNMDNIPNKA